MPCPLLPPPAFLSHLRARRAGGAVPEAAPRSLCRQGQPQQMPHSATVSGDKAVAAGGAGGSRGLEQNYHADPVQHGQQGDTAEMKHQENTPQSPKEQHMLLMQKASPCDNSSRVNPTCAEVGSERQHLIEHTQRCPCS